MSSKSLTSYLPGERMKDGSSPSFTQFLKLNLMLLHRIRQWQEVGVAIPGLLLSKNENQSFSLSLTFPQN